MGASPSRWLIPQKLAAEMIGTFALVFAGCGAIVVDTLHGGVIGHVGIAATFGLVITVMIHATGHVSGAHFNPAVTVAFASIGAFPWREVPGYVLAQIIAATAAALALSLLFDPVASLGATMPAASAGQSFGLEVVLTFFLMFVIASVATSARAEGHLAGIAIGGTVGLCALFGGPVSGASMNPARSLGPAVVSGDLATVWIYLAAPLLGALAAAWAARSIRCGGESRPASGCC